MDEEVVHVRELKELDAKDWCYRGEGAANIVLAYHGDDPLLVGKVLRLRKIPVDNEHLKKSKNIKEPVKPVLSEDEQKLWENWPSVAGARSLESLLQAYARDVMSPLLGSELIDPGILVHVSTEFLEKVAGHVQHERPWSRRVAAHIDTRSGSALLISDHSVFRPLAGPQQGKTSCGSISVEIKPKCGFLPDSDFIIAENFVKKTVPRFTMHQILKLNEGQVKVLSQYSPLDLFSENLERINQAVHNLFRIPQNNLRLFVGGSIIDTFISDSNPEGANWPVLNEALQNCMFYEDEVEPVEVLKELVAQSLYETNALRNLLAAQKLDTLDIEGSIHAYRKIISRKPIDCLNGSMPDDVVDQNKSSELLDGMGFSESMELVRNYLIAATAKDCSLMLTFQQVLDFEAENTGDTYHKLIFSSKTRYPFRLKIKFLDLDLKRMSKMHHYHRTDQEIVKTYLAVTQCGYDQGTHS